MLNGMHQRLVKVTANCRGDMHEPDNQGIGAVVSGYCLDNAMGDSPIHNCGELTVGITTTNEDGYIHYEWFNLATLIALARRPM